MGALNDVFRWSPITRQWSFLTGSTFSEVNSSYHLSGYLSNGTYPGSRFGAFYAHVPDDNSLWLFGGSSTNGSLLYNDLFQTYLGPVSSNITCDPGSFWSSYRCLPCVNGTYKSLAGQQACSTCPTNTTCSSTSFSCIGPGLMPNVSGTGCGPCPNGTFKATSLGHCEPCPLGYLCSATTVTSCAPGYSLNAASQNCTLSLVTSLTSSVSGSTKNMDSSAATVTTTINAPLGTSTSTFSTSMTTTALILTSIPFILVEASTSSDFIESLYFSEGRLCMPMLLLM